MRRRLGRAWAAAVAPSHNPMLRWTDRVQAWVLLVAIMLGLAIGALCTAGSIHVFRSHLEQYQDSQTHRAVAATVVETAPGHPQPHQNSTPVMAMWLVGAGGARGGENLLSYSGWVRSGRQVSGGDHVRIWIDDEGLPTTAPTPSWQAGVDAAAFGIGLGLVGAMGLVALVRLIAMPLDRIRLAQWEAEIATLAGKGRRNRPQS